MAKPDDHLEIVAERIYMDDIRVVRGISPEQVARKAFQKAAVFCKVADAVRAGERIQPLATSEEQLYVIVHLWDGSQGQHGEAMHDDNGRPVTEVMPVDRYAFAPNLPEGHPVNQRFLPYAIKLGKLCDKEGKPLTKKELEDKGLLEPSAN